MVALLPDADSAAALHVGGGVPLEQLHLTLAYLGDDVTGWAPAQRGLVLERAMDCARWTPPLEARVFAHATFNPDAYAGREPCGVYLVGESERIEMLHNELRYLAQALQHPQFVPHITGRYGGDASDLAYTGPVRFDRLVVALADQWTELPLTGEPDQLSREQLASMTSEEIVAAQAAGQLRALLHG